MYLALKVLGSNLWFDIFFTNYLQPMGWWAHMAVGGGGRVHEGNLNLNLNMSLNSEQDLESIWRNLNLNFNLS
jgi:hypothetical protein